MKRENVVNELIVSAEQNGLIQTLYSTFGNSVKVSIPFSKAPCSWIQQID